MNEIKFNPCPLCVKDSLAPNSISEKIFSSDLSRDGFASLSACCPYCRLTLSVSTLDVPVESCNFESVFRILAYRWNMLSLNKSITELPY